jgi:hypothetical protein
LLPLHIGFIIEKIGANGWEILFSLLFLSKVILAAMKNAALPEPELKLIGKESRLLLCTPN